MAAARHGLPKFRMLLAVASRTETGYDLLRLLMGFGGITMKRLGLVLVLCGAASLAVLPGSGGAFEIQGAQPDRPDVAAPFAQPQPPQSMFINPDFKGYSLATPYSSSEESPYASSYGNAIPIPAPGVDQPAPAWALSPAFRR
jgi:hypothetical protein